MMQKFLDKYIIFLYNLQFEAIKNSIILNTSDLNNKKFKEESKHTYLLEASLQFIKNKTGNFFEFGVHRGISLKMCSELIPTMNFFGFDSFEGFPNDGRPDWKQDFKLESSQIPKFNKNVTIIKGYFANTLPRFVKEFKRKIDFINIDCDIYSSTNEVFKILNTKIKSGCIIHFDEFFNYYDYPWNESLAFFEFLLQHNKSCKVLAFSKNIISLDFILYHLNNYYRNNVSLPKIDNKNYRQQLVVQIVDSPINFKISNPLIQKKLDFLKNRFEVISKIRKNN